MGFRLVVLLVPVAGIGAASIRLYDTATPGIIVLAVGVVLALFLAWRVRRFL